MNQKYSPTSQAKERPYLIIGKRSILRSILNQRCYINLSSRGILVESFRTNLIISVKHLGSETF